MIRAEVNITVSRLQIGRIQSDPVCQNLVSYRFSSTAQTVGEVDAATSIAYAPEVHRVKKAFKATAAPWIRFVLWNAGSDLWNAKSKTKWFTNGDRSKGPFTVCAYISILSPEEVNLWEFDMTSTQLSLDACLEGLKRVELVHGQALRELMSKSTSLGLYQSRLSSRHLKWSP